MSINVLNCSDFIKEGLLTEQNCDKKEHYQEKFFGCELETVERKISLNGNGNILILIETCGKQLKNILYNIKDEDVIKVWNEKNTVENETGSPPYNGECNSSCCSKSI